MLPGLQSNLKWNKHVEEVVSSANCILGLLHRNIKVASTYTKYLAYKALISPKLEFAAVVWSLWLTFLGDNVERIQRHSARYVFNDYRLDSSVSAMIDYLNWDSLEHCRKKASLHTFYKMFNNLSMIPYPQYVRFSRGHYYRYKILLLL